VIDVFLVFVAVHASAWRSLRSAFACELFAPYFFTSLANCDLFVDVALILVAVRTVLVQSRRS